MKTYLISALSGLTALTMLGACATTGQLAQSGEYDDMYFTASDRNTVEFTELNEPGKAQYNNKGSYEFEQESYSSKNVNPDLIAQYQNDGQKQAEGEADYYVEEYDREDERPTIVNNFYGPQGYGSHGRYSTFGNPFYRDPFYDPYYSSFYDPFYSSFYDPFWGPRRYRSAFGMGFGLGFAFGSAWHNPWSWRNPYYASFYDPFYGYYGGYHNRFWGRPSVIVINNNNENIGLNRRAVNSRSDLRTTRANDTRTVNRGRTSVADNTANGRSRDSYVRNSRTAGTRDMTRSYNSLNDRTRRSAAEASRSYNTARSSRGYSTEATRNSDSYTRSRSSAPSRTYSNGRTTSPSYNSGTRRSYDNNRNSGYTPSRSNNSSFGTGSSGSNTRSSGSYSGGSTRSSGGGTTRGTRGGN